MSSRGEKATRQQAQSRKSLGFANRGGAESGNGSLLPGSHSWGLCGRCCTAAPFQTGSWDPAWAQSFIAPHNGHPPAAPHLEPSLGPTQMSSDLFPQLQAHPQDLRGGCCCEGKGGMDGAYIGRLGVHTQARKAPSGTGWSWRQA